MRPQRIEPAPGQESVWDYPRPPRVESGSKHIQVVLNNRIIADTYRAKRVLETSHPPVYYIPSEDVHLEYFTLTSRQSYCEWKGTASYYTITVGERRVPDGAWFYPRPTPGYALLTNAIAFYPSLMDACYVDGEKAQAQPGGFYGGWITADIVGPFKGDVGTSGW